MAKVKNDYFQLAEHQMSFCVKAADMLRDILNNYSADELASYQEAIHAVEHAADEVHHDILTKLSSEFITPIDQEDILHLVQIIDDVTDALDEVTLDFYMYNVTVLPEDAPALSNEVCRCVKALDEAIKEMKNFKKPEALRKSLVEVNDIESNADIVYIEAIHKLFVGVADARTLVGAKAVYEALENCCDLCEHAADVIEQIIIKNT